MKLSTEQLAHIEILQLRRELAATQAARAADALNAYAAALGIPPTSSARPDGTVVGPDGQPLPDPINWQARAEAAEAKLAALEQGAP